MLKYLYAAYLMAILHLLWILIGLLSIPLLYFFEGYKYVLAAYLAVTIISWIASKDCLFRVWENHYRRKHSSSSAYTGTFIAHYIYVATGTRIPNAVIRVAVYTVAALLLVSLAVSYLIS